MGMNEIGKTGPTVEDLLGQYAEILNESGGPEAEDAKTFLRKHPDEVEFQSLAQVAGVLWKRINKK